MANIVRVSYAEKYRTRIDPPAEQNVARRQLAKEMGRSIHKTSAGPLSGVRIPDGYPVTQGTVQSDKSELHDILNGPASWSISDRVRKIIEDIEPDVHQYFPMEIVLKNGSRLDKNYWTLNISTRLDSSIDPERSTCIKAGPDLERFPDNWSYMDPVGVERKITVKKSMVAGRAIWRDARCSDIFISDSLFTALLAADVEVLESEQYVTEF